MPVMVVLLLSSVIFVPQISMKSRSCRRQPPVAVRHQWHAASRAPISRSSCHKHPTTVILVSVGQRRSQPLMAKETTSSGRALLLLLLAWLAHQYGGRDTHLLSCVLRTPSSAQAAASECYSNSNRCVRTSNDGQKGSSPKREVEPGSLNLDDARSTHLANEEARSADATSVAARELWFKTVLQPSLSCPRDHDEWELV